VRCLRLFNEWKATFLAANTQAFDMAVLLHESKLGEHTLKIQTKEGSSRSIPWIAIEFVGVRERDGSASSHHNFLMEYW